MAVSQSAKGILIALGGVLVLTPDTLFMRWSEMDGAQMIVWRGWLMGAVFLSIWMASGASRSGDLRRLATVAGLTAAAAYGLNSLAFSYGIAVAPVSVVLIAVATVPVWAAVLSRWLMGEPTRPATWMAMALVVGGIAVAVSDGGAGGTHASGAVAGAVAGLVVALMLGLSFVLFRKYPDLPILLCIGVGSVASGAVGFTQVSPPALADGQIWAIALTGLIFLPLPFFALSVAARFTHAANVSLILLLETVLGPLWVWAGTGEAPGSAMWLGGFVVVVSLAGYILWTSRRPVSG